MRIVCACVLALGACGSDDGPTDDDIGDDTDGATAEIVVPASSRAQAVLDVTWSEGLTGKYLFVTDEEGNDFTTATPLATDTVTAMYDLPAGRTFTATAGHAVDGERVELAEAAFTTTIEGPCDEATQGYAAAISQPATDEVVPAGRTDDATFGDTFTPAIGIPDRYELLYDETAGHEALGSNPGYDLVAGHTYTFELGWYCLSGALDRPIPLAAVRFRAE